MTTTTGMTVKFFNLVFIEDYGMTTTHIAFIQICYAVTIAAFTFVLGKLAKIVGRAQVSFCSFLFSGLMLFLLV